VRGEPATPASDVYALGVMLFEALAGGPPFRRENPEEVLNDHQFQSPPSLLKRRPDLHAGVGRLVDSALAKAPDARPDGAAAFRRFLQALVDRAGL
jgi:serine/threonine protein kinase